MVVEFWRHSHKEINIAIFTLLITGYRSEEKHRSDAESILKLFSMSFYDINVFALCLHALKIITIFVQLRCKSNDYSLTRKVFFEKNDVWGKNKREG